MEKILSRQREFFNTGKTKDISFRKEMLNRLLEGIYQYESKIYAALKQDLNKSEGEAYLTEIQMVTTEIKTAVKHLKSWAKPQRVKTPISQFPASGKIYYEPYGTVLILSPWNYPFQLALAPVVGALAAGNTVILKTSKSSPQVSCVIRRMLEEYFSEEYLYVVPEETEYHEILAQHYDMIFFTGSERVGKIVMEAASKFVTPVVLELGGKSPCIVEKTANLLLAARRIAWGKFLNAGQTCVAPDYLLVERCVADELISLLKTQIHQMYGNALENPDYPKIINRRHFDRLVGYLDAEQEIFGGRYDVSKLRIEPTLLLSATDKSSAMQEEIFGPILPVIVFDNLDEVLSSLQNKPRPLACYLFTQSRQTESKVLHTLSFGGGCVNDTVIHLANHYLPFGGLGSSGMGSYHGKHSFVTFSHQKGILHAKSFCDIPFRYPPYTEKKLKLIKKITK